MRNALAIFGLLFGVAVILASIFKPAILGTVRPANQQYVRISGIVVGALFVVLAIMTLAGTM